MSTPTDLSPLPQTGLFSSAQDPCMSGAAPIVQPVRKEIHTVHHALLVERGDEMSVTV